jgi:hypothetical protein
VTSHEPDELPAECQLIRDKRLDLGLSMREAARRASMPEATWRQSEQARHEHRPSWTLARMAFIVGAAPAELEGVGRKDAARDLRVMMAKRIDDTAGVPAELRAAAAEGARAGADDLLVEMALGIAEIDQSHYLTNKDKAELREEFMSEIRRAVSNGRSHVHTVLRVAQARDVG